MEEIRLKLLESVMHTLGRYNPAGHQSEARRQTRFHRVIKYPHAGMVIDTDLLPKHFPRFFCYICIVVVPCCILLHLFFVYQKNLRGGGEEALGCLGLARKR